MKTNSTKLIYQLFTVFSVLTVFTFSRCKKDSPIPADNPFGLPNATQTGADVFACRINGANWISKSDIYSMNGHLSNDSLSVSGSYGGNVYFDKLLLQVLGGAMQGSQYQINLSGPCKLFILTYRNCSGNTSATSYSATEGNASLTKIDKINKIFSGTFYCKIPVVGCDTLIITDGRFDINYY